MIMGKQRTDLERTSTLLAEVRLRYKTDLLVGSLSHETSQSSMHALEDLRTAGLDRPEIQSSQRSSKQDEYVSQLDEEPTMEHQQECTEIIAATTHKQTSTDMRVEAQPETQTPNSDHFDHSGSVQYKKVDADNVDQLIYLSQ